MTKIVELVRKSCLIRNIERLNKSKITIQDIEDKYILLLYYYELC